MSSPIVPTVATGRLLLSYRRSDSEAVSLLESSLHVAGIPTWRDIRHLPYGDTIRSLDEMLRDTNTAGAIFYITRDLAKSDYVINVEAPAIFKRASDPAFLIVPVAADGLSYAEASAVFEGRIAATSLASFNMERAATPFLQADADDLAMQILRQRVRVLAKHSQSLRLSFTTRKSIGFDIANSLTIDHRSLYLPSNRDASAWMRALRTIENVISVIEQEMPKAQLEILGFVGLSYALALGRTLSLTRGVSATWLQATAQEHMSWSLSASVQDTCDTEFHRTSPGGDELALLVSINDDVLPAFGRYRGAIANLAGFVVIDGQGDAPLTAERAAMISRSLMRSARDARRAIGEVKVVHVFGAMPAGVAFMIGQLLNTFPEIQTYEFTGVTYEQGFKLSSVSV